MEFIEGYTYNPTKVTNKVLADDHRLAHAWISTMRDKKLDKIGGRNKEDIYNLHRQIIEEMKKRGMHHNIVDKELDGSITFQEEFPNKGSEVIPKLKTFVVIPEFISLAGSSAEGRVDAKDIDVIIKLPKASQLIEDKLIAQPGFKDIYPDLHFVYDTKGSHGDHIPVYDLVAVKRTDLTKATPEYSYPLFGAAPQHARLPSGQAGMEAYLHRELLRSELLDGDGNRITNYPELENDATQMKRPDTFILAGYLMTDGTFEVQDILRWNTTELVDSSPEDRKFFLDKFVWTERVFRKKKEESLELEERIILMKPFVPLKTKSGYGEYEFNNVDDLIKFWAAGENLKIGIVVQPKFDGFRIMYNKKGNEVKAFTEDKKRDRAEMLPAITNEIKKLDVNELIFDTEVVMYDEAGKPRPRHEAMAIIASKTPITEPIKANIHDCLWFNGPKNNEPYTERIALARKAVPKDTKHLIVAPAPIAHTEEQLRSLVRNAAKFPGSEGAMLKVATSQYPLTGRTPLWAKLKLVKEITLKVIGIRRKKAAGGGVSAGTFLYRGAFLNKENKLEPMNSQHTVGPKDMQEESEWQMGAGFKNAKPGDYAYAETYASNVAAKIGDLITVAPAHILKFRGKDGKDRFATMFPRMRNLETAKTKPDTQEQLEKLAALGEGSAKMKLEDVLKQLTQDEFPITIKEL